MKPKKLKEEHIDIQFLTLLIAILSFLGLAYFVGNIVWVKDFYYFVVLISGIFAIFIGLLALLRYYSKRNSLNFLFLGAGFLGVGVLDIVQIVVEIGGITNLFAYSGTQLYPLGGAISKAFLAILFLLSWFVTRKSKRRGRKREFKIMAMISTTFVLFVSTFLILMFKGVEVDSIFVVLTGLLSLLLYILALLGYLFDKGWMYEDFNYWIIFALSFLILSQIFYLPFLNIEYSHMINLSAWAKFFAYAGILAGFLNSIYAMYQQEKETQDELREKSELLDRTKAKVEEAYLVLREEKWDLVNKKGGLKSVLKDMEKSK